MTESLGNILIVDDLPENLRVLTLILMGKGYKVRKAIDGKTALLACQSTAPDLILLDIKMPELDGYEVCQQLKNNPQTREIPVIFISVLNEVFDKVKAFEVGGVDYITKPFQVEEVIARIESQLTIKRQKILLQQEIEKRQQKEEQLQQEIAKRREAEEILYQSRALIKSVLNTSLDGIAAMEAVRRVTGEIIDFCCILVNPVIAQTLGIKAEDVAGKPILKKFLNKIDPNLFNSFVEIVETGNSLQQDVYYSSNQNDNWYHFIAVKLGDGFSITIRDITERKKIELQLHQANKILNDLANLDGLTQVKNRRYFDKYFAQEWQLCLSEKQPFSLIMCDVDYFKSYNDNYGHQQGDLCLTTVAQLIRDRLKSPRDLVARYGGEEFVIILPNTNQNNALNIAELIRQQLQELQIEHSQSLVSNYVTLSFGLACVIPNPDLLPENLLFSADQALYQAKNLGRNQIVIFEIDQ